MKPNVPQSSEQFNSFLAKEEMELLPYIMKCLDGVSRTKAKSILSLGGVHVNHIRVTRHDFLVKPGMLVNIKKRKQPHVEFEEEQYYNIIYEDYDIIVVDKSPCVLSMGVGQNSLNMKMLLDNYLKETRQHCTSHVVHRLDTRTSGVMVYAKSVPVQRILVENWHEIVTDRRYVAVVDGYVNEPEGHIETWLKDTPTLKVVSSPTPNGGKWASTDWRRLKANKDYSLLEFHLHTGRKNQIRVHAQIMKHPIVGDHKYGSYTDPIGRLGLHAFRLCFYHPVTNQPMRFETPFPDSFLSLFD